MPRDRGVVESIAITPRWQYGDDRLVSLLECYGPLNCWPVMSERGI